mgnify:CR=1 FL=1
MSFEILIQSIDGVMKIENSNHHHQKKKKQKKIMQIINFKGNDKIMSSSVFFPIKITFIGFFSALFKYTHIQIINTIVFSNLNLYVGFFFSFKTHLNTIIQLHRQYLIIINLWSSISSVFFQSITIAFISLSLFSVHHLS